MAFQGADRRSTDHGASLEQVGIQEAFLMHAARHATLPYGERYYAFPPASGRTIDLAPYRRFYAALVLQQVRCMGRGDVASLSKRLPREYGRPGPLGLRERERERSRGFPPPSSCPQLLFLC